MSKRLTYDEMKKICDSLTVLEKPYQPYPNDSHWWRTGENEKYAYESNDWTVDHRIIIKKTGVELLYRFLYWIIWKYKIFPLSL